jgi:phasin family protein
MPPKAKSEKHGSAERAVESAKERAENVVTLSAESATRGYETAFAATQEQFEKAATAAFAGYDEFASLGKDNFEAVLKSSGALVKGFEALGKEVASYGQASVEKSVANAQALFGVKTLRELIELQSEFAKQAFDSWVEQGTKLGELGAKMANEAFQPIQTQLTVTVEKVLKPAAA